MLNLKLHSLNTIYKEYSTSIHLMLGPQVGIVVKETHNISYCDALRSSEAAKQRSSEAAKQGQSANAEKVI